MSARVPLLAGNWKMHATAGEAVRLADAVVDGVRDVTDRDVLVAPPFPSLAPVAARLAGSRVLLAGQNLHWEDKGAFTGEVSGPMLAAVGCTHAIVGHSERRQFFGDTDEWVARKAAAALRTGLTPIVCVGETLQQREAGDTLRVVRLQVDAVSPLLATAKIPVAIAYEPVWAIGTGKTAQPKDAEEVHAAIRGWLGERDPGLAGKCRILYGGSVKADNAAALLGCPNVDGALVGGSSLDATQFGAIAGAAAR